MRTIGYRKISNNYPTDATFVKMRWHQPLQSIGAITGGSIYAHIIDCTQIEGADGNGGPPLFTPPLWNTYWDQYQYYIVYGSKITITYYNVQAGPPTLVAIYPTVYNISTPAQTTNLTEQPYCKWRILTGSSGSNTPVTLSHYMSTTKLFGFDVGKDNRMQVTMSTTSPIGTPAATPGLANSWGWNIIVNPTTTTAATDITYSIRVTWYVKFYGRKLVFNTAAS